MEFGPGLPDGIFLNQKSQSQLKMLVYFKAIWYILRQFGIFCFHLVYFMVLCYIFHRFGILCQEKSGNPGVRPSVLVGETRLAPREDREGTFWFELQSK
jgi:hypothetical protein